MTTLYQNPFETDAAFRDRVNQTWQLENLHASAENYVNDQASALSTEYTKKYADAQKHFDAENTRISAIRAATDNSISKFNSAARENSEALTNSATSNMNGVIATQPVKDNTSQTPVVLGVAVMIYLFFIKKRGA